LYILPMSIKMNVVDINTHLRVDFRIIFLLYLFFRSVKTNQSRNAYNLFLKGSSSFHFSDFEQFSFKIIPLIGKHCIQLFPVLLTRRKISKIKSL